MFCRLRQKPHGTAECAHHGGAERATGGGVLVSMRDHGQSLLARHRMEAHIAAVAVIGIKARFLG